jgi:hypothetical protein
MDENIEQMLTYLIKTNTSSYTCLRCNKSWKTIKSKSRPVTCKYCKSPSWDKPSKNSLFKAY